MVPDTRMLAIVLTISLVTIALRAVPFVAMDTIARSSYLRYLGTQMPIGVMLLLVAYTVKDENFLEYPYGLPHILAGGLTVLLYITVKNSLVAILAGLALFMLLVNLVV
jgi:branched-subunit amino acid transport protein AzlD